MASERKISFGRTLKAIFPRYRAATRSSLGDMVAPGAIPGINFGTHVDNYTALKNTAFYAGIRLIAENIASLPKSVRTKGQHGWEDVTSHPAYALIAKRPNAYTNACTFWSTLATWMKGWGNAYAIIRRNSAGQPVSLHQVHPSSVQIVISNARKWYRVTTADPNFSFLNGVYADEDMLHFMELTLDGVKGVNPIIYNAIALGKSQAMEKFASEFYNKGGNLKAVMETDGNMTDDEYSAFMKHMTEASGNFETPLLEYGIKYKQLSVDPVAAQLVQSEVLSIQDVCRILNVPPHMIAELSHATFSNIEHQTIQFVQYSLRPVIKRIETELETKLFFSGEQDRYDVKFILDGLLRGDTTARAAYYHNAILDGYMSRNEVRELEGMPYAEGLDDYLYPINEAIVGKEDKTDKQ